MKYVTFKSNFGRFAYSIKTTIGDEVNKETERLCLEGIANLGFRAVASDVEKALTKAGFLAKVEKGEAKAKRDSVAYDARLFVKEDDEGTKLYDYASDVIESAAQAKLDKLAKDEGLPDMEFRITGEHFFGVSSPGKEVLKAAENFTAEGKADKVRAKITAKTGYVFNDTSVEELARGIQALNRFLAAEVAKAAKAVMDEEDEAGDEPTESSEAGE